MQNTLKFLEQPRNQRLAILLALVGAIPGVPLAGLHKFYLRQPGWGGIYLLLSLTLIPHVASVLEALWYLWLPSPTFDARFNGGVMPLRQTHTAVASQPAAADAVQKVNTIAIALRELEALRQEGLLSEYEFECQRRQLIER